MERVRWNIEHVIRKRKTTTSDRRDILNQTSFILDFCLDWYLIFIDRLRDVEGGQNSRDSEPYG